MLKLKDFKYLTINTECDIYWSNNTGCQYPLICPKGTKVEFVSQFTNYYGTWFEVKYEDEIRYVLPNLCNGNVIVKAKKIVLMDSESLAIKETYILTDRYGKRYRLLNEKGDLELL